MEYIFITGMGRSGTKFLTSLLNTAQDVNAVHEYVGNREFWLLSWYLPGNVYAVPYLERQKKAIDSKFNKGVFIDINGYLQNSVNELNEVFKPRKIFHFVRDPREVVRSLYTRRNDADIHLIPKTKAEVEKWLDGNKFTQICWNWASTTEQLINQQTELILFEKLKSDYGYFKTKILDPLGLTISQDTWDKVRNSKVNKTHSAWYRWLYAKVKGKRYVEDKLPPYEQWPAEMKKEFLAICGSAMEKCGYSTKI